VSINTPLPDALKILLAKARAKLKAGEAARVELTMTEVRAVYAMSTKLHAAQEARDKLKHDNAALRKALAQAQKDARDQDLLNNRAVVALLIEVDGVLKGTTDSDRAVHAIHERLQRFIQRASVKPRAKP
jgi:hypothetical protein